MSSPINARQLLQLFPNEASARQYLEQIRWPDNVSCPNCSSVNIYTRRSRIGFYGCRDCRTHFSVRTNTVFEKSHVKLHKWIHAIYLLMGARMDMSSMQLSKKIGTTQNTAWFILHRLRLACSGDFDRLKDFIKIDEISVSAKEGKKRTNTEASAGRGGAGEQTAISMRQRGGHTNVKPTASTNANNAPKVKNSVEDR